MFWFLKRNIICKMSIILESKMGFLSKISGIFKKKNKMSFTDKSLEEIDVELKNSDDILQAYKYAYARPGSTVLVEFPDYGK